MMAFEIIGEFQVDQSAKSVIGRGVFGEVLKAKHRTSKEPAAVKRIDLGKPDDDDTYLEREISALMAVKNHPNVVSLLHYQRKDGFLWLVMDFCEGGDIHKFLTKTGINKSMANTFIKQCVLAIHYLHTLKPNAIIHRDIKPGNFLIKMVGGEPVVKVSV